MRIVIENGTYDQVTKHWVHDIKGQHYFMYLVDMNGQRVEEIAHGEPHEKPFNCIYCTEATDLPTALEHMVYSMKHDVWRKPDPNQLALDGTQA
jgi:hypothetical protein